LHYEAIIRPISKIIVGSETGYFERYFLHLLGADYIIFLNMCDC
jgi:hypothetical protein